jgi:hypothetical protein
MSASTAPGVQSPSRPPAAASHDLFARLLKAQRHDKRIGALREAMLRTVTPEDIEVISNKLLELAKEGSFPAIRLYLAYIIGKPSDFQNCAAWMEDNDAAPQQAQAWEKVDLPVPAPEPSVPQSRPAETVLPDLTPVQTPAPEAADVNGGKRLSRQQRRALRRQAKKLNGGNGWLGGPAAADDPLAALIRQRDLLR